MRKQIYIIICFLFSAVFCFSQSANRQIDSLLSLIKNDKEDTNKVIHLYKLSVEYKNIGEYDRGIQLGKAALDVGKKIDFRKGVASAYNNIGRIYADQGNYQKALENYSASLKIREEIGDKKGTSDSYSDIGVIYMQQGNYDSALENYFVGLKIREEIQDKKSTSASYNNIGLLYWNVGKYNKALENFLLSLKIDEELENKKGIAASYNNIGLIYLEQGNYDKALENFLLSLKINEELGNKKDLVSSYNNIGNAYSGQAELLHDIGLISNRYKLALENYFNGLKIAEKINDKKSISMYYNNIGDVYRETNENVQALAYLQKGAHLAQEIGANDALMDAYKELTATYVKMNDYKNAYQYQQLYIIIYDKTFNENSARQIAEMQTKYETEKKEKENERLVSANRIKELQLSRGKLWIFSVSILFLICLILAGLLYNRFLIKQKIQRLITEKQESAFRQKIVDLELQALRAQINPHFVVNCINSIQNCVDENNLKAAEEYLSKFARLLRIILETSKRPLIVLSDELKLLELYLDMEKLHLADKLSYRIEVPPEINPDMVEIPIMLIQPFIENSIKHGIRPKFEKGNILIDFKRLSDTILVITVEDDGIGRDKAKEMRKSNLINSTSIGIQKTQERLTILSEQQHKEGKINIVDLYNDDKTPRGTRVEIHVPV